MDIIHSDRPAQSAGELLSHMLKQYSDVPVLLMLSGGSALSLLAHVATEGLSSRVTLTTLDERYSADPAVNNFAQIAALPFYASARQRGVAVIDTSITEGETLEGAGQRFAQALQQWRTEHPHGVLLATMGIGADGHTAGIFPGQTLPGLSDEAWVAAYQVPESVHPFTQRITVTYTFLRTQVNHALVYGVGNEKAPIIAAITQGECTVEQMPACILRSLPKVTVVTDQR